MWYIITDGQTVAQGTACWTIFTAWYYTGHFNHTHTHNTNIIQTYSRILYRTF